MIKLEDGGFPHCTCTPVYSLSRSRDILKRLNMCHVTWPRLSKRRFVICRLGFAIFNPHIKFEESTITCNEEMKGNVKCKNSRFEPLFGGLRVTHRVHLWLDGKRIVDILLAIIEFSRCIIKRSLSKSAYSDGVGHFERKC